MKKTLFTGLVLFSALSFAAPRHTASTSTSAHLTHPTQWLASVGPAITVLPDSGETGFGTNFTLAGKMVDTVPLYLGMDITLTFWGNFLNGTDNSGALADKTGLAFLPMAIYEFNQDRMVRPYVGVATGPYLNFGQLRTDAHFALFFKPGLNIAFADKIGAGVESKFGALAGTLIWAPQATINFTF